MQIDLESVTRAAIDTIFDAHAYIRDTVRTAPGWAFNKWDIPRQPQRGGKNKAQKPALNIDVAVESLARAKLKDRLRMFNPLVLGEEYGDEPLTEDLDVTGRDQLVILLDMVDGTDLLERNLSNWCSAMVFYYPREKKPEDRIIAAFIGLPGEAVYFARRDRKNAEKATMY